MTATILLPPELEFLRKYIRGGSIPAISGGGIPTIWSGGIPASASETDNASETESASETVPVLILSEGFHHGERPDLREQLAATGGVILNVPDVVGTGMTGFPRRLAEAVDAGTFFHFPGNEARRSTIHATDVAHAVALVQNLELAPGQIRQYTITDGSDPTVDDLAEAIAYRMNNKRISNLSLPFQQWVAGLLYGRRRMAEYTTPHTVEPDFKFDFPAFKPTPVCEYLRTHNYDDNSL